MKLSDNAKRAIKIGSLCFFAYLAVYLARNVLSTVTPGMQTEGFSKEAIGAASSVYFITYAIGQLINGAIGDKIKARYMMSFGLAMAGVSNFLFSLINSLNTESYGSIPIGAYVAYGCTGFFLAMIYGPMTKVVAENTEMPYTTRCSLGYTFASYFGSPVAGLLATFLAWQSVFSVSSVVLVIMAAVLFVSFLMYEKQGLITYNRFKSDKKKNGKGSIKELFKRQIVKFSLVSILTGIVRTSVLFWLPTYFNERLNYTETESTTIFTVASLFISCGAFIVVFVYEKLGHDLDKTVLLMFSAAALFFAATYFVSSPIPNIVLIILAIMSSNGAATMLWSRYCPGLRDTGIVSGVTGFLDFLSYMAAASANVVFPFLIEKCLWGWGSIVLIWVALMIVGIMISLPWRRKIIRNT